MRKLGWFLATLVCAGAGLAAQMGSQAPHQHVAASDVKWGPGPPGLPPGVTVAALYGDPAKEGQPFTLRVKMPAGYKVPAHWHPTDETLTVLQGALQVGTGDKFDQAALKTLGPGDFAMMPAKVHHFAAAKGETIFQVNAMGPFAITYVNPDDDPRNKKSSQ